MGSFSFSSIIDSSLSETFNWHEKLFCLERLTPPWENIEIVDRNYIDTNNLINGGSLSLIHNVFPFIKLKWKIKHSNYIKDEIFRDYMVKGPLKNWTHDHIFQNDNNQTKVIDKISFNTHIFEDILDKWIEKQLESTFEYRHKILKHDLCSINLKNQNKEFYILITGGNGLIGKHLIPMLNSFGYKIIQLKYNKKIKNYKSINIEFNDFIKIEWNPYLNEDLELPKEISDKIKYVINLSGENILGIPTKKKKELIMESRKISTNRLLKIIKKNKINLQCCIHASATGFYGNDLNNEIIESSTKGDGFLSDTTKIWEDFQNKFNSISNRVINLRIGAVLSRKGGFLKSMTMPYKMSLGIKIKSDNFISHISIEDLCRSICYILKEENLNGPINAVCPQPEKLSNIFNILRRKYTSNINININKRFIEKISPELNNELLFSNQYIIPKKLLDNGFQFLNNNFNDSINSMYPKGG